MLLAGCSLPLGGSVGPNEWWLTATTPDRQQLLVTSLYGGLASGCSRWEEWEVSTSDEQVEVTPGEPFDPNRHEALMRTPHEQVASDHVVQQLQPGYRLGEKTLRPAQVSVAE
jgi:hypothetical protein